MSSKNAKCWACFFWDNCREICTRDGSGHSGEHREAMDAACEYFSWRADWRKRSIPQGEPNAQEENTPTKDTALTLATNVEQMGRYLAQMGQLMATMQRRMDEMEARQAAVTISHADVKRLQKMIRVRADEICRKYELQDKDSPKIFRAAIRKDLLKRFLVKDLHDLPEAALSRAEALADSWANIRLVMERRGSA